MQLYGLENTKDFDLAFYALIPAAGAGTRLRGEVPKQYLPLAGKPMLWHAVQCGVRGAGRERVRGARAGGPGVRAATTGARSPGGWSRCTAAARRGAIRCTTAWWRRWRRWMRTTGCWCTMRRGPACRRSDLDSLIAETRDDRDRRHSRAAGGRYGEEGAARTRLARCASPAPRTAASCGWRRRRRCSAAACCCRR